MVLDDCIDCETDTIGFLIFFFSLDSFERLNIDLVGNDLNTDLYAYKKGNDGQNNCIVNFGFHTYTIGNQQ